jgi:hypothetical protein
MLSRMKRLGSTGLEGEKATNSPRWTRPVRRFRNGADTFAAVRNRQPDRNLAVENHSRPMAALQALGGGGAWVGDSGGSPEKFCPAGG